VDREQPAEGSRRGRGSRGNEAVDRGGSGGSGAESEAIKGPRDGGASHGPGATAALYPCGGLAAEHTESTVHPGAQVASKQEPLIAMAIGQRSLGDSTAGTPIGLSATNCTLEGTTPRGVDSQ
jgi:hypothetical protein